MPAGIVRIFMRGLSNRGFLNLYYTLKPAIPRGVQLALRRKLAAVKLAACKDCWPIDAGAAAAPCDWPGWPGRKKFALVLTHDVDTPRGLARCRELADMEKEMGFRSSFNFVAHGYPISPDFRRYLEKNGFEIGIHGLRHDGKLYKSRKTFLRNASVINSYLKEWGSVGFRSPSMHSRLDWIHELEIEYDASTFDTDPFEPQCEGALNDLPLYCQWVEGAKGVSWSSPTHCLRILQCLS